ncbi:MAG: 2-oxo acid dehydrogenase subunit E2 [Oscillospiraceae bacterium]|jgi:pyruvate/2-oxoglutarate dehydrogenase complex dihydrolipoamide acyltransferase (E2) component|nr:2-oxo acid dehydrogenase subunit E2 [Oscillospiraceae bacterium]
MSETKNQTPYKRRFGDRKDGRRIRTLDPYHALMPYIMVKKNDACNYISDKVEVTEIDRYLRRLRTEGGMPGLGMMHLLTAVYIRTCAKYPALNRFIAGQRLFARYHPELVMTIKTELKVDAPETSIKVPFDITDTISDVYRKINEHVAKVKKAEETNTDDVAGLFSKIPRLVLKFAIWLLTLLDYFGKVPQFVMDASPFHGSLIITDLGSIGLPAIFHHIYNFGNLPIFLAIGAKRKEYETQKDGTAAERKYCDLLLVIDERVSDGFYFSQAYRYFKSLLKNPAQLELPPDEVVEDLA